MSAAIGRIRRPRALGTYFALLLALLYLPLLILFVFSINDGTTLTFPIQGITLQWYQRLFTNSPALFQAVWSSVQVAVGSSIGATILGTALALLLTRFQFRTKPLLGALAVMPLVVPYVVLAVALLIVFRVLGVPLSLLTVAIAHIVVELPYTTLIVLARLVGFGNDLEDAAMDLGATYPATLRLVVLPIIAPAIVAAWMVAFTVSFDEFALALFLAGPQPTFPVYLFGQLRYTATLPVLIAGAVLLMVVSLGLLAIAERVRRDR